PNFITTTLMPQFPSSVIVQQTLSARRSLGKRFQLAQTRQQLCIQNGRAGRSANGVVREQGELPVEHIAGTQAAHRNSHAVAAIAIQAGLRSIALRSPLHRLLRSSRQSLPGKRTELSP